MIHLPAGPSLPWLATLWAIFNGLVSLWGVSRRLRGAHISVGLFTGSLVGLVICYARVWP